MGIFFYFLHSSSSGSSSHICHTIQTDAQINADTEMAKHRYPNKNIIISMISPFYNKIIHIIHKSPFPINLYIREQSFLHK